MEEQLNKKLEETIHRIIKETSVEKTSINFTTSIMQVIQDLETKKVTNYKPLISKPVWAGLGIVFMVLIYVITSGDESTNSGWFNNVDFSVVTNNKLTNSLKSITLSKTVAYAIGLFGLMFCIQIPFLKYHFNQRFHV